MIGVPEGLMMRPTLFAIFDNVNDELTLAAPVYPQADITRRGRVGSRAEAARGGGGGAGTAAAASSRRR